MRAGDRVRAALHFLSSSFQYVVNSLLLLLLQVATAGTILSLCVMVVFGDGQDMFGICFTCQIGLAWAVYSRMERARNDDR